VLEEVEQKTPSFRKAETRLAKPAKQIAFFAPFGAPYCCFVYFNQQQRAWECGLGVGDPITLMDYFYHCDMG